MFTGTINGFFPPEFEAKGRINLSVPRDGGGDSARARAQAAIPPVDIIDARPMQQKAASETAFFAEHGFVLLDAPTAVDDWDCDQSAPGNPIAATYLPQVEEIIRTRLLPNRRIEVRQPAPVMRRGPGTANPAYGSGAHQDYGLTADDFEHSVSAFSSPEGGRQWRARYESDDVEGFLMLDFWRTAGMSEPLQHMPLAVCDPASVDPDDVIETALAGIAPGGGLTHNLALRYNPAQRWYYYPRMTPDEVLVFKIFQAMRGERPRLASCIHSAVADPGAPADAAERQSSEHRVGVLVLKD